MCNFSSLFKNHVLLVKMIGKKGERKESLTNDEEERMKRKRRADDYQHGNETESDPEIEDEVR